MKKNTFAAMSTVISTVYKVTFILGTIAGFVLWIVWWRDYKKFLQKEEADEKFDKEFPVCNEALDGYKPDSKPSWFDEWKKTESELSQTCKMAEEDDDELY